MTPPTVCAVTDGGRIPCTPLLLEFEATVTGTNALFRSLDFDDLDTFKLLLSHAAGTDELKGGRLLFWAIRRRRSPAHIEALLAAGVDPAVQTKDGVSAYVQALRYGLSKNDAIDFDAVDIQFVHDFHDVAGASKHGV